MMIFASISAVLGLIAAPPFGNGGDSQQKLTNNAVQLAELKKPEKSLSGGADGLHFSGEILKSLRLRTWR